MRILQAIILGVKLSVSLFLFKLRGETFKVSLASSILFNYIKAINSNVGFLTEKKQRRYLIARFANMSRLINDSLESENISQEQLVNIVCADNTEANGNDLANKISNSFLEIKRIVAQGSCFGEFLENAEKSWKANDSRNIKKAPVLENDILKATKESGGFFFLALAYLLNPEELDEEMKEAIYNSGAWFQFLDDYRDRKEDVGRKETIFTKSKEGAHKELLRKNIDELHKGIENNKGAPINFMENLTSLIFLFDFTKNILDWK